MILLIDYGIGNLRSVQKALQAVGATVVLSADPAEIARADRLVLPGVGAFGDGMAGLRDGGWVPPLLEAVGRGVPLLGICLGMQLLFERSEEAPGVPGLGLLPGEVRRFPADLSGPDGVRLKVPHTGWNQLWPLAAPPLLAGLEPGAYAYFNHAYYCVPERSCYVPWATVSYANTEAEHPERSAAESKGAERPSLKSASFDCTSFRSGCFQSHSQGSVDVLAESDYGLRFAAVVGRGNLFGVQFHPEKSQAVGLRILRNFVELCR